MKPGTAKKILNCSYTTLHNYVKSGKIRLSSDTGKQQNYDGDSVRKLYEQLHSGESRFDNCIHIFVNGRKYEFSLDEAIVRNIMNSISDGLMERVLK